MSLVATVNKYSHVNITIYGRAWKLFARRYIVSVPCIEMKGRKETQGDGGGETMVRPRSIESHPSTFVIVSLPVVVTIN